MSADLFSPDAAGALVERAVGMADGVPLQASLRASRQRVTRLGNGVVLNHSEIVDARLLVRAVIEGAEGLAVTNDLSDAGLRAARDAAVEAARAGPPDPEHPGLPDEAGAGAAAALDAWDEATARGDDPGDGEALAALAAARDRGAKLAGLATRAAEARALANTRGLSRFSRRTMASAKLIANVGQIGAGGTTGHAGDVGSAWSSLDVAGLADRAAAIAAAAADPAPIPAGRYDVVLEPAAVVELLKWLAGIAFDSRSFEDGTSALTGRLGEAVTGPAVTMTDPGPRAALLPVAFDDEGVARRPVTFIEAGVARGGVHDRVSAARAATASTGHRRIYERFPGGGGSPGAVCMAAGDADDLLARLGDGLHVQRFHYVNGLLDPLKTRMTGLTRDGLFEIRGGRRRRAVQDLRFTEDIFDAFRRVEAIGRVLGAAADHWAGAGGAYQAPALLIRGFTFTGTCAPT